MSSPYQQAIDADYTPEEIDRYLSQKDPKYKKAIDAGYSSEEIINFLYPNKQKKETIPENINRQFLRAGARGVETILGAPRALGETLESVVPEKLIGKVAGKIGLKEPVEKGFELAKKYAPYKLFPESEQVRKHLTQGLFGKHLEPKNKWEEKADELVTDFAALAIPVPGSQLKLLKPALLAAGGNIASETIGQLGGTEKQKTYGKLGTIFFGSLVNPKAAENLKNSLYNDARNARPPDAKTNATRLENSLNTFERKLQQGDPKSTSKKKSFDLINSIKSKIKNNEIDVNELEEFKIDINEARSGLFDEFKLDKTGRKRAKRNLDLISKFIDKSLDEYGRSNPQWEAFYRPANEVHGAIAQSKKTRDWILRHSKQLGFPALLAELGLYHFAGLPTAATAAGLGTAALAGGELTARIMKSPTLRKHYTALVNAALKEDVIATRENLKKLNEELEKENSNPKR